MTQLLKGTDVRDKIKEELAAQTSELIKENKEVPGLAVILVGDDPASQVYVRSKAKMCNAIGFHSEEIRLDTDCSEEKLLATINTLNERPNIHGILVQLPLPKHINEDIVIQTIKPEKDVDGFHPVNVGNLLIGKPGFVSCTPAGIIEILKFYNIETSGKHAVIVGRSNIVGKPMAALLVQKSKCGNATVTICHSRTKDIASITRQADILIAAIGVPNFIKADMVKDGAVIIDVGINRVDAPERPKGYKLVGDVAFEEVSEKAEAITPVPGGVGPMTIAMLMKNTLEAYKIQQ